MFLALCEMLVKILTMAMIMVTLAFIALTNVSTYRGAAIIPVPFGYGVDLSFTAAVAAPCHVLRLTSDNCPHCRADRVHYERLAAAARSAGCQIATLGLHPGQVAPRNDGSTLELEYVEFALGQALVPFSVPQTLLLDREGRIVWQRQGRLTDQDVNAAARRAAALK